MKRIPKTHDAIPRPLFPEHMPAPRMARIGWTAAERKAAEAFLAALDRATERLEQQERQVAA